MSENLVKTRRSGKIAIYTVIALILMSVVVLALIGYLYNNAEERAYENLHIQTKQIKDDLTLQILSDRENLATMANFAAKLYLDGDDYSIMFNSFKPIGLIENIGILGVDNIFVTKSGSISLNNKISFTEEAARGAYISGRVADLTNDGYELVRTAVPIVADGETVGILYGVIKLDKISGRYTEMAEELNAQLFIYDAEKGDLIVDTVHGELGNISFLEDRKYNKNYSYEEIANTDKGFSSFESAYRDEDVLMHYSTIEELDWKIALVRYDSQVFSEVHSLMKVLFIVLIAMIIIMITFSSLMIAGERSKSSVSNIASDIRKILLEASGTQKHITDALKEVCTFTESRSAIFFDTNGEDYNYIAPKYRESMLTAQKIRELMAEILRYVSERLVHGEAAINIMCLDADKHLAKTNPTFYKLMKEFGIYEIVLSATVNNSNHITVLGVINPKRKTVAKLLAEKVSACFSIALSNKTILNRTMLAATTDALTGAHNRVAYNNDVQIIDEEKPTDFSCIYVDVNELHYRNNKYGHAAGDEMLLFIAHSLKDVFFGHKVYRMGGDEFLVFCQNSDQESVNKGIAIFNDQLKTRGYNVSLGVSYRSQNTNTEEMVREAELKMYEDKAKYYQNKEEQNAIVSGENDYVMTKTGIIEIDTMLSVLRENYLGIYRVSLDDDMAKCILAPAYLKYNEKELFSSFFSKYVSDSAESDYHRALLSFRNYDAIKQQLAARKTPKVTFKKLGGDTVTLSVYKLSDTDESASDTLWIFAKK